MGERLRTPGLLALLVWLERPNIARVSTYFFRVVEQEDGSWLCRRGREDFDTHGQRDDAIEHTTVIASEYPPSQVFVHHLDGQVDCVATLG